MNRIQTYSMYAVSVLLLLSGFVWYWYIQAIPRDDYVLHVTPGMTGRSIAGQLRIDGVVRSTLAMRIALAATGKSQLIQAGAYPLNTHELHSVVQIADALTHAQPVRIVRMVTVPEGSRGRDILAALANVMSPEKLEGVTEETFDVSIGYLFPDTYAIDDTVTVTLLLARMRAEYEAHIAPLRERIAQSGYSEAEVVTLASIIEREANDEESMRRVAGILHNRIAASMRLQVDATLTYLLDKTSAELTKDDLSHSSPFNTYRVDGLPPTPIANPGLTAIKAVLDPIASNDLFYLTGDDGNFYYAETFAEHTKNKERYLR